MNDLSRPEVMAGGTRMARSGALQPVAIGVLLGGKGNRSTGDGKMQDSADGDSAGG